ncbi:MAG: translation initiation factor IF-2 [Candidatus Doudnabacteria bacterium RIFCSPLOWO2_02_FULL_49_13]|uniref:Translation initiation factor IF-2 n=1 Tax=Candidatus Doudnabacteria bacterium RIFCSPHIGHO2_12_FULL_48_16 TaxID=1817838 RepID=A0A1F5PL46_9BACT|nr:MAG: translation initiation factor IF-2 [Candidatus Doudnabacteria bacterium RIFCSPHIGHO2_02_FULL_49_24]OGE88714.1 MAG: translation initiation factor IF-2 [Candidatus Doudnabacteria bacterium RIFCSPHIGHO2_01_FULL_50_67]OGE90420.1 MAG: translation initiation factor IF-2 [Candidatus Doudnabacteria bacterium RIFCSPHIGHO2_12_FULL_48_16]OGE97107.1 MAG: translation initiation factor IF-2 [Candidatus Doudnabacteria bacterium RIFCSPLOWO2_01_FULL_49_40]OGF02461.1 MAG: translation initiation factor IF
MNSLSQKKPETGVPAEPKDVSLPKVLSVKELAAKLGLDITVVIKKLIQNGVMATINEEIDYDTAAIVAGDLGFNVSEVQEATTRLGLGYIADEMKKEQAVNPETFIVRPPIVAIMGHVDHGKTTLLDTMRNTKVVDTEAGRITQHIGAYQVAHNGKFVTFLDTPGHEAFSAMRARGANVTDMIVLVVAADDGVKPQTIEVINRAKLTATPLIVAINKIDKPDANLERVKKELADFGVLIEEWGGTTPVAKISALTGQGVDDLLDLILLQAEVMDLKANPTGQTMGTVIEAHLSRTLGPVATVIVQNGTLSLSDIVAAGKAFGKIRSMIDARGAKLKTAPPSRALRISGISDVPQAGDILKTYATLDEAKIQATAVARGERAKKFATTKQLAFAGKDLNLIIKVDVLGSLEAINDALSKLKNTEVKINVLDEGAGEVNENDVLRADSASGVIIGFHTKVSSQAAKLAQAKGVTIQTYDVIYELIEDITRQVVDMLTPEVLRTDLGRAKILAIFRTEKDSMIIGGNVAEGKIKDGAEFEIKRGDEIVGKGLVTQLQQNKIKTKEVLHGSEFGANVKTATKIEAGDVLVLFEESVRKKTL